MSYDSRLDRAFQNAPVLPLNSCCRYCLISDCHRGDGSSNDNFLKNQNLYFTALKHYYANGFTYIELGDGDELWENRRMSQIIEIHNNVFWLLSLFHKQNRLYLLYGNHDMEKKKPGYSGRVFQSYFCTDTQCCQELFPDLVFQEGLILENRSHNYRLFLTHGHQADFWNSTGWRVTRFLVRYLWQPLEHFGVLDPTSAARNYTQKDRVEQRLSDYASKKDISLVTGHTHRPRLDSDAPFYLNTGSCVHPRCITCIEIQGNTAYLVKWACDTRRDNTLYVNREILAGMTLFGQTNPLTKNTVCK